MKAVSESGALRFGGVSKRYDATWALRDFDAEVPAGQILAILGPSGSGKSTLINLCAGVAAPTSGCITIGGRDICQLPIEQRDLGVVFQSYALFPHLTVRENIAFSLRTRRHRCAGEALERRVDKMLGLVRLDRYGSRHPDQLSGGQQQRVALARALAFGPRVLLLDEPLGALDPMLKQQLLADLRSIRDELKVTMIYVTHDQTEAMIIADQVAVLNGGRLQQIGTPSDIYNRPTSEFVATFVGQINLIPGRTVSATPSTSVIETSLGQVLAQGHQGSMASDVVIAVRPESIAVASMADPLPACNSASGIVRQVTFLGASVQLVVEVAPLVSLVVSCRAGSTGAQPDTPVRLTWLPSDTHVFDAPWSARFHADTTQILNQ